MDNPLADPNADLDPNERQRIQGWAKARLNRPVLRRAGFRVPNVQPQQVPQQQPPVAVQRQQIAGSVAHFTAPVTPTGQMFQQALQGVPLRLTDLAAPVLIGLADTLVKEEKDLKNSKLFVAMMKLQREYEGAAMQRGANLGIVKAKRDNLRDAAKGVMDHYEEKYASELKKPQSAQARGYAAAKAINAEIVKSDTARNDAIGEVKVLIADLKQQIATRQAGGAAIDRTAITEMEKARRITNLPTEIEFQLGVTVEEARAAEGDAIITAFGNPPDVLRKETFAAKAAICFELGTCKSPKGSDLGASDSFFLRDHKGKLAFVFKPMEGEADQSARGWERGGAAPRELLASALNDQLSALLLDCGISKAALATLDDPALAGGRSSQAQQRTGALLEFAPNNGSLRKLLGAADSSTPDEDLKDFCTDGRELAARKGKIVKSDLQKMALFDLVTLNLDRSPSNILVRTEGDPPNDTVRLIPIDGGNLLPCRDALDQGVGSLAPAPKDPEAPLGDSSGLMQLDQASDDFDPALQAAIDAMDADALSTGLRNTCTQNEQANPAFIGGVKPEVFDTMKVAIKFLKRACGTQANPRLTPADMAQMYHLELSGFLARTLGPTTPLPNTAFIPPPQAAIERDMDRLIAAQVVRRQQAAATKLLLAELKRLGGAPALVDLGWPKELPENDLNQALDILRNGTPEPAVLKNYNVTLGGDAALLQFDATADLNLPIVTKSALIQEHLKNQTYVDEGGDGVLDTLLEKFAVVYANKQAEQRAWNDRRGQVPKDQRPEWQKIKGNEQPEALPIFSSSFDKKRVREGDAVSKTKALRELKQFFDM